VIGMLWSMTVRPFTDDDLDRVGLVHSRSRQAAYAGLVPADALAAVTPEAQARVWRERLLLGATLFVGEDADGEVVGFVNLLETDEGTELNAIHLLPEALGTGLGSALMGAAVEHARAIGRRRLHLFVLEGNERAQAFYRRQGWRLAGYAGLHDIGGAEVGHVRYELSLAQVQA
jgi:ribosomal protein S18 acetylase RimI-like enzyme